MNTPIIILFLASAVAVSNAAVEIYPKEQKPAEFANQEGCYISKLERVLPYDTQYHPGNGECIQYICQKNNETIAETCGVTDVPENCTAVTNTKLNYPDCCDVTGIVCSATAAPTTTSTEAATTVAPTTTSVPPTPQISSASAHASSQSGQPPVVQASATPGASAAASAS